MSQEKKPVILLIEADQSLRRLISLGLQQHSMQVIEAASPATLPAFDMQQPDLLILDIDKGVRSNWSFLESVQVHAHLSTLPIVVLAWESQRSYTSTGALTVVAPIQVACVSKPFDARILHQTIVELLALQKEKEAAIEARAEAQLLASYSSQAAPSLWPVVTAAGLLLAVVGMLLQAFLAVAGLLVIVVALLLWTLGTKPVPEKVAPGVWHSSVNT